MTKKSWQNYNILRTKRAFKAKWKAFFIIFKRLSLKQITQFLLHGKSPTLKSPKDRIFKFPLVIEFLLFWDSVLSSKGDLSNSFDVFWIFWGDCSSLFYQNCKFVRLKKDQKLFWFHLWVFVLWEEWRNFMAFLIAQKLTFVSVATMNSFFS